MTQTTVNQILDIFQDFRMPPSPIDQYEAAGKQKLADRLSAFVASRNPIKFSMLGYPFKSINDRDKVLGKMPDLGEKVSMDNFADFANRIQAVYSPGACFSIISDGYIFSDLFGVSDADVRRYEDMVKDMGHDAPIDWYDMYSFYPRHMTAGDMREKITTQYGVTSDELERRILMDPDINTLYRGMIRFMNEDLAIKNYPSGNQLQKAAKILAREMMFRNEAYSHLVQDQFADHIRLSMHPSINSGAKYSFQLIPSKNARHSPWHSALLINKDGGFETIHRKDAVAKGFELVYENNQPYYFKEQ